MSQKALWNKGIRHIMSLLSGGIITFLFIVNKTAKLTHFKSVTICSYISTALCHSTNIVSLVMMFINHIKILLVYPIVALFGACKAEKAHFKK